MSIKSDERDFFRRCVRCGECCKVAPCWFGEWDSVRAQCRYLVPSKEYPEFTIYACGIHDKIVKHVDAEHNPAFGAGCCRTLFNEARQKILLAFPL